jgi:hypothetical protein
MSANVKPMMIRPTAAMDLDKTSGKGVPRRRYVAFVLHKGFPHVVSDTDVALPVRWYTTISVQILARGQMPERRHLHLPSRVEQRRGLCIILSQHYSASVSAIAHKHDRHSRVPEPKAPLATFALGAQSSFLMQGLVPTAEGAFCQLHTLLFCLSECGTKLEQRHLLSAPSLFRYFNAGLHTLIFLLA